MAVPFHEHPNRLAAIANFESVFDAGEPCKHGHASLRYVNGSTCVECMRLRSVREHLLRRPRTAAENVERIEANTKPQDIKRISLATALARYESSSEGREHSEICDAALRALDGLRKSSKPKWQRPGRPSGRDHWSRQTAEPGHQVRHRWS